MVRTSQAFIIGSILALIIAILSFIGGWTMSVTVGYIPLDTFVRSLMNPAAGNNALSEERENFAIFWDVWDLVDSEFYRKEPLDKQQMVYGAIRGMLMSLGDNYTTFQEPDIAAHSRESMQGKFEGIGAYLRVTEGLAFIDRPIHGSPAEQAGLQSGDQIVKVDGQEIAPLIEGLSDDEASAQVATLIRGPKGSTVVLTIQRSPDAEAFDVPIVRDEIPLISVRAEMLDDGVAYIQITEFKAPTVDELDAALRELLPQQPSSIVLDLRSNPGGFLKSAREILGRFYEGIALYEENSAGEVLELTTISAPSEVQAFDLPMVVLIDGNSASAAEIVAGALRDQRPRTTLLGEQSFGKGSVQNIHQLRDGSSVRITIARWFTPNQDEIHQIGITPQFVVPPSDADEFAVPCVAERQPAEGLDECRDAQLAWSLRFLTQQATPPPPDSTPAGYAR